MNTLVGFLSYIEEKWKDLDAYVWSVDGLVKSKSFTEFVHDARLMACEIHRRFNVRRKIALIGDMSYSWICTYYGIMNSSNISVPMDTKLSPSEMVERLVFADVSVVFLSDKYSSLKTYIEDHCNNIYEIVLLENYPFGLSDSLLSEPVGVVEPDALASLMFTSGTSGDGLKAAMITHRSILADVTGEVALCIPGDRLLSVLPVHHCFELFVGQMKYLYQGAAICVNDSLENVVPNLTKYGITIIVTVPAMANMFAALVGQNLKTKTIDDVKKIFGGKLKAITIGGASVSKEVIHTLGKLGITVFVGYGLTETTGGCLANTDAAVRPLEAGKPYVDGMDVKITADGEVCFRGPMLMQGYYKAPALTSRVMEGEWFHTGDLGILTEEGYLIISGRKDNMIKTANGEKVYPEEWESRLANTGGITAAMVCAVNDHLVAIVHLKEDTPANREAIVSQIDDINAGLPNYQKIADVRFRETPFPVTTSLKIRRAEVLRELSAQCGSVHRPPENEGQMRILELVKKCFPENTDIGIDDNLFEYGMDSLLAVQLAVLLNCDVSAIYENRSIRKLSEICEVMEVTSEASSSRMLNEGMKIPNINRLICNRTDAFLDKHGCVLLTGASGYLGIHLLHRFAEAGIPVICLIRSRETFQRASRFYSFPEDMPEVQFVIGDITKKHFGLSDAEYKEITGKVNVVFHTAAMVSHVVDVRDSYRVNVSGTQEVIRFCEQKGARLFHMSSYAVAGFSAQDVLTEHVLDIGQEITQNPYIQTKYQAEEKVLLARERGIGSAIFRIGNLASRKSDGRFQMNEGESGMTAQLRALRFLGVYPESMAGVRYDFTAVDEAARAISLLAWKHGTGHIWHIMNPNRVGIGELTGARPVSDGEFHKCIRENSQNRDVAILSVYYKMFREGFKPGFDMNLTLDELSRLGFQWSPDRYGKDV